MALPLKILPRSLPAFVRKAVLAELFIATADAFRCPAPQYRRLAYNECLLNYALFTRQQAEKAMRISSDVASIKERLYLNAAELGKRARSWFALKSPDDVMSLGRVLYRSIGIEIEGSSDGSLIVNRCYFCRFYSPSVCDLISALDDGVFSGLSGGGRLVFSQRITGRNSCCLARLIMKENNQ